MTVTYLSPLDLRVYKPGLFVVLAPFRVQTDYGVIPIPRNLITDLASTPKALHGITAFDPDGGSRHAAVMHDCLYAQNGVITTEDGKALTLSREQCDVLLREGLLVSGMSMFDATAFYLAVREFGQSHWDANHTIDDYVTDDFWTHTGYEHA